jgi:hypothetical protein
MSIPKEKYCHRCKVAKSSDEFYRRRKGDDLSPYCKPCTNDQTIERQRAFKRRCVVFRGGKCEICGYDKCDGALEFHHIDPLEKDFQISKVRLKRFTESVEMELNKCIMVCSNCHKEIHWNRAPVA